MRRDIPGPNPSQYGIVNIFKIFFSLTLKTFNSNELIKRLR